MKITISKTGRIILAAGIIIMIMAWLIFTWYQQSSERAYLKNEIEFSELKLTQFNNPVLEEKITELELLQKERLRQVEGLYEQLDESIVSADVAEMFFKTAYKSYVTVFDFNSIPVDQEIIADTVVQRTSFSARVEGSLGQTIDFIINLNKSFSTGYVNSARFDVAEPALTNSMGQNTSLQLDFIVYTIAE